MSTVPAAAAGEVAVIVVALLTLKAVALVEPNCTAVAPVRFVPVIVTVVPPAAGPDVGLTPVTVGVDPMPYGLEVTEAGSDVVATVNVVFSVLDGLVTEFSSTVRAALAPTLSPPKKPQVATRPDSLQEPMSVFAALSTELLFTLVRLVPDGNVIVIWLSAAAERPPVEDVLKEIV